MGLVELRDVGAGRLEVACLRIDRRNIIHKQRLIAPVVAAPRLLLHPVRPRKGGLNHAVRVPSQKFNVTNLGGTRALERTDGAGAGFGLAPHALPTAESQALAARPLY